MVIGKTAIISGLAMVMSVFTRTGTRWGSTDKRCTLETIINNIMAAGLRIPPCPIPWIHTAVITMLTGFSRVKDSTSSRVAVLASLQAASATPAPVSVSISIMNHRH